MCSSQKLPESQKIIKPGYELLDKYLPPLPAYPPGPTNGQAGKSKKIKSRVGLQVITGGGVVALA